MDEMTTEAQGDAPEGLDVSSIPSADVAVLREAIRSFEASRAAAAVRAAPALTTPPKLLGPFVAAAFLFAGAALVGGWAAERRYAAAVRDHVASRERLHDAIAGLRREKRVAAEACLGEPDAPAGAVPGAPSAAPSRRPDRSAPALSDEPGGPSFAREDNAAVNAAEG